MNKYWLYLESFVDIEIYKDNVLFYNFFNNKKLQYADKTISKIAHKLKSFKNGYVILVDESFIENNKNFIIDIRDNYFGDLINSKHLNAKPQIFHPVLFLASEYDQKKINTPKKKILKNLSELTLHINTEQSSNPNETNLLYKLYYYPQVKKKYSEITISILINLFNYLLYSELSKINIVCGNIFEYSNLKLLLSLLEKLNINIEFHIKIKYLPELFDKINLFSKITNIHFHIYIENVELGNLTLIKNYEFVKNNCSLNFLYKNNEIFTLFEKYIIDEEINNYNFLPLITKKNHIDIINDIKYEIEDIFNINQLQKDILIKKVINPLNFGKLTITSKGHVFANLNKVRLGNLLYDDLKKIILKEMTVKSSWFLIRQDVLPCKKCLYKNFCPPISNFEQFYKKNNLCNFNIN